MHGTEPKPGKKTLRKVITCGMTIAKFRMPIARPAREKQINFKKCNHDNNASTKWKYLGQGPDFQHD